jgi:hypothetical protein
MSMFVGIVTHDTGPYRMIAHGKKRKGFEFVHKTFEQNLSSRTDDN